MKKYLVVAVLLIMGLQTAAQWPRLMAFPITDYITDAGDSVIIVQIKLPAGFSIKEKTNGLVRSVFNAPGDSVITVGSGRCQLIKGDYCYFGLLKKYMRRKPVAGDLMYTDATTPPCYSGYVFDVVRHNITINSVQEKLIAGLTTFPGIKTSEDELPVLNSMLEDVKFTARVMSGESNNQDMTITDGKFKNQKLFAAMQAITTEDVKNFLQYINTFPEKYASHTWKFSEIMATWMVGGAPTVR